MAIKNWNNGKPNFSYEGHANLGVNLNRQKNAPLDSIPLSRICFTM